MRAPVTAASADPHHRGVGCWRPEENPVQLLTLREVLHRRWAVPWVWLSLRSCLAARMRGAHRASPTLAAGGRHLHMRTDAPVGRSKTCACDGCCPHWAWSRWHALPCGRAGSGPRSRGTCGEGTECWERAGFSGGWRDLLLLQVALPASARLDSRHSVGVPIAPW